MIEVAHDAPTGGLFKRLAAEKQPKNLTQRTQMIHEADTLIEQCSPVSIKLSESELFDLTSYRHPSKQLWVLQQRGFLRAYINRLGVVVLERAHYEAVTKGELHTAVKKINKVFINSK